MRSPRSPMLRSALASALALAVCGCSSTRAITPPVADLTPAPEPLLPAAALTSAAALDAYDIELQAWGRGEHGKVARLCRWFSTMKAKGLRCEP